MYVLFGNSRSPLPLLPLSLTHQLWKYLLRGLALALSVSRLESLLFDKTFV